MHIYKHIIPYDRIFHSAFTLKYLFLFPIFREITLLLTQLPTKEKPICSAIAVLKNAYNQLSRNACQSQLSRTNFQGILLQNNESTKWNYLETFKLATWNVKIKFFINGILLSTDNLITIQSTTSISKSYRKKVEENGREGCSCSLISYSCCSACGGIRKRCVSLAGRRGPTKAHWKGEKKRVENV